ncbi:HAD-IIB family hydrolase [Halomonas sp. PAMB 3264]|uniref:HAD-IIB family hydrolase n=1 Tax=Halomonas sp. PAMB 3264 TaxID=3075222 RepID=UPI002897ED67|nr:HAD-IIB family hydrolase [Halomonas sp. PAMB 3264]WNL42043.1 HAD-IIB family hydrolase [Halomonas sp. PAMB 3264]
MHIVHIALQGCLRGHDVEYGITADTGGHIRYLLELVEASALDPAVTRLTLVTRAFTCQFSDIDYGPGAEQVGPNIELIRLPSESPDYLSKEALWQELPSFTDALVTWLDALRDKPAILHAHYADAGEVAADVQARRGIPFVFTAHSLGRSKRKCLEYEGETLDAETLAALTRRIAFEERAIRKAALIIASSRDEAESQYADYDHYAPGKIRVIAPGSHLDEFESARSTPAVDALLAPFLTNPDKPALIAIARPVTRKNLATLVRAFGENDALREKANLVIVAGVRDHIDDLESELADNLHELLTLIDDFDLYGHIAYPKHHAPQDIKALYAWARERRGIFINPALNEPFGLTLLEAAAAGLPLIATDSGGPNDIIEQCGNGVLINPRRAEAIGGEALALLNDPARWQQMADNGRLAVKAFDWQRHVERYHDLLSRLCHPCTGQTLDRVNALLICDIDNTLTGSPVGVLAFNTWYAAQKQLGFGVATGRSFHSALAILSQAGIPYPPLIISSVGSEIHYLNDDGITYRQDTAWREIINRHWQRDALARALDTFDDLLPQGPLEQRAFKLSYLSDDTRDITLRLTTHLKRLRLRATVIHSHGRYVDILPEAASKGRAVAHVRKHLGVDEAALYVAGDSGNDLDMLRASKCSILVANYSDGLAQAPGMGHVYIARAPHAQGVIEGVKHFQSHPPRQPLEDIAS